MANTRIKLTEQEQSRIEHIHAQIANKQYLSASELLQDFSKLNLANKTLQDIAFKFFQIIVKQSVDPDNELLELTKTKGFSQIFYAYAYRKLVMRAKATRDKQEDISEPFDISRMEIYYKLSAFCYPEVFYNFSVHVFMAKEFMLKSKPAKALEYYLKCIDLDDPVKKIINMCMVADCHNLLKNEKEVFSTYKECIEIFKGLPKELQLNFTLRPRIAEAAHFCAVMLDNSTGPLPRNALHAISYYRFAVELKSGPSMHNLAWKYEMGEDLKLDLNRAVDLFRRAVEIGHKLSLGNLFVAQEKLKQDVGPTIQMMQQVKGDGVIYHLLGYHYYNKALKSNKKKSKDKHFPFYSYDFKLAHDYYQASATLGYAASMFNLGCFMDTGNGIERNESKAEKFYQDAAAKGYRQAVENLAALYQAKLISAKKAMLDTGQITKISSAMMASLDKCQKLPQQLTTSDLSILTAELTSLKLEVKTQSMVIGSFIRRAAHNQELTSTLKFEELLKYDILALDTINLVTILHKLGACKEGAREYNFSAFNDKIFALIREAEKQLDTDKFSNLQIALLAEGVSKLYLQLHSYHLENFFIKLLQKVSDKQDQFEQKLLIIIIFAVSRLDVPKFLSFKSILPALINKVVAFPQPMNLHSFANCFYAAALLHLSAQDLVPFAAITQLVELLNSMGEGTADPMLQAEYKHASMQVYQQLYLALSYFSKQYPDMLTSSHAEVLVFWQTVLTKEVPLVRESNLQRQVLGFIQPYFDQCEPEKFINTLPVDAYLGNGQMNLILQVDGPSHFLHAEEELPQETLKLKFRNHFLRYHSTVVTVNYFDWDKLTDDAQRYQYFSTLLQAHNIVLKKEYKWQIVGRTNALNFFASLPPQESKKERPEIARCKATRSLSG